MLRLFFCLTCLCTAPAALAAHAFALGTTPKYPASFTHFAYVNPQAKKGGELQLPNPDRRTSFDSFNPFVLKGSPAAGMDLLFESLGVMSMDEVATMYGLLAQDIDVASDGLSVTFQLNPAARFNNGDAVLAVDVKHSFTQLTSKQASPAYRSQLSDVIGVEVLGERKVRFRFGVANPELVQIVGTLPVFSHRWGNGKTLDKIALDAPITSGPYQIASYQMGRQISLQRRSDYWAKDLPVRRGQYNFDRIHYRYYQDNTARLEAFKAGEFDFITEYSARNWVRQYQGPKFRSGELVTKTLAHHNINGMQGFVMNTRRAQFADRRVRQAIGLALDFEWMNRQLFYNQYQRLNSFYANGDLAASGAPTPAELQLLTPLRGQLPSAVFAPLAPQPSTAAPGSLRDNLRRARDLLAAAGWTYRNGALRNTRGDAFAFEILDDGGAMQRVYPSFVRNLAKLGIAVSVRTIDFALYQRRMDAFDFDMTSTAYSGVQSPGQELLNLYGSRAADVVGSNNISGLKNPAVDRLIGHVIAANDNRAKLATAVHALDRTLLAEHIVIPHWYSGAHRVAWRNRFAMPTTTPLYYQAADWMLSTWWIAPH